MRAAAPGDSLHAPRQPLRRYHRPRPGQGPRTLQARPAALLRPRCEPTSLSGARFAHARAQDARVIAESTTDADQSRSEIGLITRVVELPTLWFGYGSADVVILATSDRDFISAYRERSIGSPGGPGGVGPPRRQAHCLRGRNRDNSPAPELAALLPMSIEGPYVAPEAMLKWTDGSGPEESPLTNADNKPIEFTKLGSLRSGSPCLDGRADAVAAGRARSIWIGPGHA